MGACASSVVEAATPIHATTPAQKSAFIVIVQQSMR